MEINGDSSHAQPPMVLNSPETLVRNASGIDFKRWTAEESEIENQRLVTIPMHCEYKETRLTSGGKRSYN
jgi:hypothetical protein